MSQEIQMADRKRLVVLISGNGSNLQAIRDACADGRLPAQVAGVFSNVPEAFGLERARQAGVPASAFPKIQGEARPDYDARLAKAVGDLDPDWIVLAGWMRILTMRFLASFPGRIINLHPALPGTFPGTHAIQRAFESWQNGEIDRSGVMVHLVPDEGVDTGPVLGSREVIFLPGDTLEAFEARVHRAEHELLVEILQGICAGEIKST